MKPPFGVSVSITVMPRPLSLSAGAKITVRVGRFPRFSLAGGRNRGRLGLDSPLQRKVGRMRFRVLAGQTTASSTRLTTVPLIRRRAQSWRANHLMGM
jgi:hypothetical protein